MTHVLVQELVKGPLGQLALPDPGGEGTKSNQTGRCPLLRHLPTPCPAPYGGSREEQGQAKPPATAGRTPVFVGPEAEVQEGQFVFLLID